MKNVIPLIVAVILGLAAVYVVSHFLLENNNSDQETLVSVVVAARDLDAGEELLPGACSFKNVPESAVPQSAIMWESVSLTYGQKIPHAIKRGNYVLFEDIQLNLSLADCVTSGKWLIPVTFSDPTLVKMLRPQDEIAIAASYAHSEVVKPKLTTEELLENPEEAEKADVKMERETVILFPCIEVIGIDNSNGLFRESGSSTATIYVSLPPRQATILLAAQQEAELYPILRRRNDPSARNRMEIGSVNKKTFENVRSGLDTTVLPNDTANNSN